MRLNDLPVVMILTITALFALYGCEQQANTALPPPQTAVPVLLAEASVQPVVYTYDQVGTLRAIQETALKAEIAGKVTGIHFQEGARVEDGALLVQLDDEKIRAQIRSNEATVKQLEVRLANRKKEKERNEPLVKPKLVSPQQFDNIVAEIDELEAMINQEKAAMALNQERLEDMKIRSPFSGITGSRTISVGDFLETGDPIVNVVTLDPLEIQFLVHEREIPNIHTGQEISLQIDPYPDREFKCSVYFISPKVDEQTRMVEVKARIDNPERLLKPGMFARISLVTKIHEQAVVVPSESIIRTEDEYYLYYLDGETPKKLVVQIGIRTPEWTEIISEHNLQTGTKVITEGKYAVKEGSTIQVVTPPRGVEE